MAGFDPSGPHPVAFEDVPWGGPTDAPLLARIYGPAAVAGPWPAVVDVHGGAWTHFDRTVDAHFDQALAACGMIVVALDFRQGAGHPYPAAVADVVAGLRFVRANAARLDVDPSSIGLVGGSSGGHLALLAALRPNAPEFQGTPYAGETSGRAVDAHADYVLALWPIADPLARYRYLLDRLAHPRPARDRFFSAEALKAGHDAFFRDEATMARASVPRLLDAGETERRPPIWVAHPEWDENVTLPMTQDLIDAYRRAGGAAELALFPGVGHAFANFPTPAADACIAGMRAFVAAQLGA